MPRGGFSAAGRVRLTFFLAALFLMVAFIVRDLHLRSQLEHIAQGSRDMNLAGRQRMLSQRIGLRLREMEIQKVTASAVLVQDISEDLEAWDKAGRYLTGAIAKHDSANTPQHNPGRSLALAEIKRQELSAQARRALQSLQSGNHEASAEVSHYLNALPSFMVDMEAAVKDLSEALAADTLAQEQLAQTWSGWLLFLLVGLGLLFIQPLARRIARDEAQNQKLNEDNARLALVAEKTSNAVAITDVKSQLIWVNQGFTRITGYTLDEVRGRVPGHFLQYEDTDPATVEIMRQAIRKQESCRVQILNKGKTGRLYWLDIELQPLRDADGQHTGFIAVESDVTELVNAVSEAKTLALKAEAASEAKSRFLANMSHEIRTPLNGVIGITSLLLDTPLEAEQRKFGEIIRSSGEALLSIINDVLDFSKIEAGVLELEQQDFRLRELVEGVAEMLAVRAQEKHVELVCLVDPEVPDFLVGDSDRLRQVLTNITGNAVKFTDKGEVVIRVRRETGQDQTRVRIEVADTGPGITPEQLDKLFKPFSQVDSSTTRKYGGTGLGLAISKHIIERMGGRVGHRTPAEGGSVFWFSFPLVESATPAEPERELHLQGLRVLVVDDNENNRLLVMTHLRDWGCHGEAFPDVASALACLQSGGAQPAWDVIVTDMHMPEHDGLYLAQRLRAEPRWNGIKLVLLTSLGQTSLSLPEFDAVLSKPLRRERLRRVLFRLCRGETESPDEKPRARLSAAVVGLHILVVEDNTVNQMVVNRMLENLGHHPTTVANGQEALEVFRSTPFDVVLMDCQMPVMDGFEATRRLRRGEAGEAGKTVPVIALTAHAFKGDDDKCHQSGMNDYLTKPLRDHELAAMLDRWEIPLAARVVQKQEDRTMTIFDENQLSANLDSTELAREIVEEFLIDYPKRIQALEISRNNRDVEGFAREAHSIKGSAGSVGAVELSQVADVFQNNADQFPATDDLNAAFERLQATLKTVAWMRKA
jgi:PAS domain S-box-containing protein